MSEYIKDLVDSLEALGLNNISYKDVELNKGLLGIHLIAFDRANSLTIGKLKQVKQGINNHNDDQQPRIQWFRDGDDVIIYIPYFA